MNDYKQVSDALAAGAQAEMLCATCPWTRNCIEPPTMTRAEVEAEKERSAQADEAARAKDPEGKSLPMGAILSALVFTGKDTSASICPVFAMRLRENVGREIVVGLKDRMQAMPAPESPLATIDMRHGA